MDSQKLKSFIRDIPNFPKEGIIYKDITPLLAHPLAIQSAVDIMAAPYKNDRIDFVAATEARGFLFGPSMATYLDAGFIPVRKPGKLPSEVISHTYDLEYGSDTLQIHKNALFPGAKVLIVDDLLATGGTMNATKNLVEDIGGEVVGYSFLIELAYLNGREVLGNPRINAVIEY